MKKQLIFGGLLAIMGTVNAQTWSTSGNALSGTLPSSPSQYLGSSNGADLIFKTNSIERFRILSTGSNPGFIGVNNSAPIYRLDIVSSETDGGIKLTQSAAGASRLILANTSSGAIEWSVNSLGSGNMHGAGNFSIYDNTTNSRFFISGAGSTVGNVGIGTTSPNAKLEIGQTLGQSAGNTTTGFQLTNSLGANMDYIKITDRRNTAGTTWQGTEQRIQKTVDATDMHYISFKVTGVYSSLNFGHGNTDMMSILENGQVNIGIHKPQSPHNDYKLSVEGKIVAQSLYITASTIPAYWADYVFANDYKLPNLYDVEKYYKINKHLPEIPSAKEVEEKGINVGEMNALLLKKIEELTIHMVEQQKQIDELKAKR